MLSRADLQVDFDVRDVPHEARHQKSSTVAKPKRLGSRIIEQRHSPGSLKDMRADCTSAHCALKDD